MMTHARTTSHGPSLPSLAPLPRFIVSVIDYIIASAGTSVHEASDREIRLGTSFPSHA